MTKTARKRQESNPRSAHRSPREMRIRRNVLVTVLAVIVVPAARGLRVRHPRTAMQMVQMMPYCARLTLSSSWISVAVSEFARDDSAGCP
jgi:hypothetical protein